MPPGAQGILPANFVPRKTSEPTEFPDKCEVRTYDAAPPFSLMVIVKPPSPARTEVLTQNPNAPMSVIRLNERMDDPTFV